MSKQHVIRTGQVRVVGGEAYMHKQLLHPSICRLLGTAQDADHLYLLLELLSGGDACAFGSAGSLSGPG